MNDALEITVRGRGDSQGSSSTCKGRPLFLAPRDNFRHDIKGTTHNGLLPRLQGISLYVS